MTTIQVPYACSKCRNQFDVTMKLGEPIIPRLCPKCGGTAKAPLF
jgi:DNA-directed RNA polymerase subunit RPC12/RpoP